MIFSKYFDTSAIDAFAAGFAREMRKAAPPQGNANGRQAARRSQQLEQKMHRMLEQLVRSHRLNIYQKAKLGSRVQDALLAAGYSEESSKMLSFELVKQVTLVRR